MYRLESRGLLDCPIVGVAFDDWTLDQLRERAHDSIATTEDSVDDEVFERLAARLSYMSGDFTDAATYRSVAKEVGDAASPVVYLEIPPSLFATGEDRTKAMLDWAWEGFTRERGSRIVVGASEEE